MGTAPGAGSWKPVGVVVTCIVGLVEDNRTAVWLGADSMATSGWGQKHILATSKIVVLGEYSAMAVTGNMTSVTALQHWMDTPRYVHGDDPERWVARELWPAVLAAHQDGQFIGEEERVIQAEFIVAIDGRLFILAGNGAVMESRLGFVASGSGGDLAYGALAQSASRKRGYERRVGEALEAAMLGNAYVEDPFRLLRVPSRSK